MKLCLSFSIFFTNVLVLSTIIDAIVEKYGFDTDDSGFFGTVNILGGFLGGIIYGIIMKYAKIYKTLNISIG